MKKSSVIKGRIIALIMTVMMAFSIAPVFAVDRDHPALQGEVYANELSDEATPDEDITVEDAVSEDSAEAETEHGQGFVAVDIGDVYPSSGKKRGVGIQSSIPSSYPGEGTDVSGYIRYATEVKNQGNNGLCWDFGTLAVMESNLLRNGKGNYDFSELHMAYATSNSSNNVYGEKREPSGGGNTYYSEAYLMRGMPDGKGIGGAVLEEDDRYPGDPTVRIEPRNTSTTYSRKKCYMPENIYHINEDKEEVYNATFYDDVKRAVMDYGSVGTSLEWGNDGADYYYDLKSSFYRPIEKKGEATTHSVQIIGWNDSYPKTNFRNTPSGDGAWLIKNSWGSEWGDQGYFWVSYYDAWIPSNTFTIDGVTAYDGTKESIYEYDYTMSEKYNYKITQCYRSFTAKQDEVINEVMVRVSLPDLALEADVVCDPGDMNNYSFKKRGSVQTHYPGWYTIKLDKPIVVRKNKPFYVVMNSLGSGISWDEDSLGNGGHKTDKGWEANSNENGWCIKAKADSTQEYVNLYKAIEELATTDMIWSLIQGENTDRNGVTGNLADPATTAGPYGTEFRYVDISDPAHLTKRGKVTRPCAGQEDLTVSFGFRIKSGRYSATSKNRKIVIKARDSHNYGIPTVVRNATETRNGRICKKCTICGSLRYEDTAALAPSLSPVKIKKPKAAKKATTVIWKKLSRKKLKKIKRIEIQYSRDRSFRTDVRTSYAAAKKTKKTIKGLKKGSVYYVRIRANSGYGDTRHVSSWSKVRPVKAK